MLRQGTGQPHVALHTTFGMAQKMTTAGERDISAIMRKVHSDNTTPEIAFRKALWARGIRYKVAPQTLPGKPDVVMSSKRLAVFIDGDFWHGNQWRRRKLTALEDQFNHTQSKARDYWLAKIRRNMQRDCRVTGALLADGWTVLRFWESDIRKDVQGCVQMTAEAASGAVEPTAVALAPFKTFAEFFAGIGLIRMGLERKGWSIAFANDIDPQKYEMYNHHFGDAEQHLLLDDIHAIPAERVPSVTLATASFPCNDLSLAGSRHGLSGKESSAFWGFMQILEGMGERRPLFVLLENVTGFLTSHGGADFTEALMALNRFGYTVDTFMLDAARFVPQSRPRLFVVAIHDGAVQGAVHDRRHGRAMYVDESDVRPRSLAAFIAAHPEIRWAVRDLPSQPRREATVESILDDIPHSSPMWWSEARATYLLNQMSARHQAIAENMVADQRWSYGTVFRRVRHNKSMAELRTDGIAGCLRTPRGGSGRQILFKAGFGHYYARLLTPRECARLMGADDYSIDVPPNQALFGFGDAVCVPAIEWIAEYYLNPVVAEMIRGRVLSAQGLGYSSTGKSA